MLKRVKKITKPRSEEAPSGNKFVDFLQKAGGAVLFLVLLASLFKNIERNKNANALINRTASKLEQAKKEQDELQKQLEMVQSQTYVEEQLRDKLGLARENEVVLVLPEAEVLRKLSPELPRDEEFKPKPNWQKWLDLFI